MEFEERRDAHHTDTYEPCRRASGELPGDRDLNHSVCSRRAHHAKQKILTTRSRLVTLATANRPNKTPAKCHRRTEQNSYVPRSFGYAVVFVSSIQSVRPSTHRVVAPGAQRPSVKQAFTARAGAGVSADEVFRNICRAWMRIPEFQVMGWEGTWQQTRVDRREEQHAARHRGCRR